MPTTRSRSDLDELAWLHLEVLLSLVRRKSRVSGIVPDVDAVALAELVTRPGDLSFELIFTVLETLGVPPGDYFHEVARAIDVREAEALHVASTRLLEAARAALELTRMEGVPDA